MNVLGRGGRVEIGVAAVAAVAAWGSVGGDIMVRWAGGFVECCISGVFMSRRS